jgi:hypothetical protein
MDIVSAFAGTRFSEEIELETTYADRDLFRKK